MRPLSLWALWALCVTAIVFVALVPHAEAFVAQPGRCNCCRCGWMDCNECEAKVSKCCDGYDYDRYTWATS